MNRSRSLARRFGSVEEYLSARQSVNVLFYREGVNSSVMVEETLLPTPGLPLATPEKARGSLAARCPLPSY